METTAARNAGLPIVNRGRVPPHLHIILRRALMLSHDVHQCLVPEQQVAPVVDHFTAENKAKKFS